MFILAVASGRNRVSISGNRSFSTAYACHCDIVLDAFGSARCFYGDHDRRLHFTFDIRELVPHAIIGAVGGQFELRPDVFDRPCPADGPGVVRTSLPKSSHFYFIVIIRILDAMKQLKVMSDLGEFWCGVTHVALSFAMVDSLNLC